MPHARLSVKVVYPYVLVAAGDRGRCSAAHEKRRRVWEGPLLLRSDRLENEFRFRNWFISASARVDSTPLRDAAGRDPSGGARGNPALGAGRYGSHDPGSFDVPLVCVVPGPHGGDDAGALSGTENLEMAVWGIRAANGHIGTAAGDAAAAAGGG